MLTAVGKEAIAKHLTNGDSRALISHMAVGTGDKAPGTDDTELDNEIGLRVVPTVERASNIITVSAEFDAGDVVGVIREYGIFDADGELIERSLCEPKTVTAADGVILVARTLSVF